MTDANSPTERLARLEERVVDINRTLDRVLGEVEQLIESLRAKLAERGRSV